MPKTASKDVAHYCAIMVLLARSSTRARCRPTPRPSPHPTPIPGDPSAAPAPLRRFTGLLEGHRGSSPSVGVRANPDAYARPDASAVVDAFLYSVARA